MNTPVSSRISFLTRLSDGIILLSGIAVLAITLLISFDVLMRYFLDQPQLFVDELTSFLLGGVIMLLALMLFSAVRIFGQEAKVAQPEAKRPEQAEVIPLEMEANLTLELAVNKLNEYDLQIRAATAEREVERLRIEKYIQQIGKEGYTIRKAQNGHWEYAKNSLTNPVK